MDLNQALESILINEWRQRLGQLPGDEFYERVTMSDTLAGALDE